MNTWNIALAVLALWSTMATPAPSHIRAKRRVKPRTDQPLDLDELRRQCYHHGWIRCIEATDDMILANSTFNLQYQECQAEATGKLTTVDQVLNNTVDLLQPEQQSQSTQEQGNMNTAGISTQGNPEPEASSVAECPTKKSERKAARQLYCNYFSEISKTATNAHSGATFVTMRRLVPCVRWKPSEEELTPAEIVGMLEHWIDRFSNEHGCCDGLKDIPEENKQDRGRLEYGDIDCQNPVRFAPFSYSAMAWWDAKLVRMAELMRAVQLLENLGDKKNCLRGCVSPGEVECVRHRLL